MLLARIMSPAKQTVASATEPPAPQPPVAALAAAGATRTAALRDLRLLRTQRPVLVDAPK